MKIPKFEKTINFIMEEDKILLEHRNYLGYSGLGDPCARKTWYSFRWVKDIYITPKIQRLFDRGFIEEPRVCKDLIKKGCTITGDQQEVVGITGHSKGHTDGTIIGVPTAEKTPHLLEGKTMKNSKFTEYLKVGLKKFSSNYWQQIHSYMGHLKLTRCLYVVTNKDTEQRDYKRIPFDKDQFEQGETLAFSIITSEKPPERIPNASPTFYLCKFCDYSDICHENAPVKKSCRTCQHWDIENDGVFGCSLWGAKFHTTHWQEDMLLCKEKDYKLSDAHK